MTEGWEEGEMHTHGGLMFKREPDGGVRIRLFEDGKIAEGKEIFRANLTDSEWASVMATCCARDEDHLTHNEALEFHNKPPGEGAVLD